MPSNAATTKPRIAFIHDLPCSSRQLGLSVPEAGMVKRSDQEVNCKSEAASIYPLSIPVESAWPRTRAGSSRG